MAGTSFDKLRTNDLLVYLPVTSFMRRLSKVNRSYGDPPLLSSDVAPVICARSQTPKPTAAPKPTAGSSSNMPSAPRYARPNNTKTPTANPKKPQPEMIFSRAVMKRVLLNSLTLADWLVRRVSSLNSFCETRLLGGVSGVAGTSLEYRALNSLSVCIPLR